MTSRHRSDQSPLRGPTPQYANAACGLSTPEVPSRSLPPISGYDIHAISFSRSSVGHPRASGSAPQASETVFREGPDDIVCVGSKGACAGNVGWKPKPAGLQNWRVQSARARGFTPDAVPIRRKKRNGGTCEHNQLTRLKKKAKEQRKRQPEYTR